MGVDYTATYGIGVQVNIPDFDTDEFRELDIDHECEWLEHLMIESEGLSYGESGSGAYSGDQNNFYIFIKNPFSNGMDGLKEKADNLMKFLKDNDVDYIGEIDLLGGVHCW